MGLLDFIKKKADEGSRVVRGAYAQLYPFDDNRTFKTTWHNAQPVDNDVDNTARIQSNAINRWTQDYRSGKIDRNRYDALMRSVDSRGDMYGISKPIQDQYRAGTIDENRYQDLLNTLGQKQAPQAEKINPLVRVVAPNALGGGRSILGMVQGASGLYDLLTPGTGENRFSQYLDQKAKATDQLIDDTGLSKLAYRGSQAALDLASLATVPAKLGMNTKTAKAAGLLDDANLFEKGIYGFNTGVGKLAPAVEAGVTKLGMPTFGKAIGYGVKEGLTGRDIIQDAIFNAKQFGEMSGKGQAITPTDIAMNVGGTLIGNPILSGAGGVVTDNLLAPVAKTLASGSGKVLVNSAEKSVDAGKKAVETGRKAVKVTKDLNVKFNPNIDAEANQLMNSIEQGEKELAKTPDGPKRRTLLKNLADLDKQLSDRVKFLEKNKGGTMLGSGPVPDFDKAKYRNAKKLLDERQLSQESIENIGRTLEQSNLEQSILDSAQKPAKVKDTSINASETLDKLKARQKTPAQVIAEQYGGKVDDIQRNIDRYGLEQTEKHYNLATSSGQAKNIDAVATSELNKSKVIVKPNIDPDVQEVVDAANSAVKNGDIKQAKDLQATLDPEHQSLVNVPQDKSSVAVEPTKPVKVVDKSKPKVEPIATEPPAKLNKDINRPSNVDGTTGEVKSIPEQIRSLPDENKLDSKAVAQIESTRDNLHNYADEVHVGLGDETITKMADDILNARGDTSKIPQASKDLYDKHFREMFEELGAIRKSEGGTIKDYYFPETFDAKGKLVDTGWGHMAEDNTVFGSNKARKGKMTTETVADTNSRIKNYVDQVLFDKYGNTKQFQVERWANKLQDQAKKSGKELALDKAVKASEMIVDLQNEIKEQVRKISFFGLGRQKNVVDSQKVAGMYLGGKELDIAGRFNQISREIGDDVDTLNARARGITSITKVDGVDYHGKRLSDHLGMTQFRDSSAFASTQVESGDDLLKVASDYINKNYDIDKHTKQTLFREVSNINNDIPDEIRKAKLASIYRQASVEQLTKNLGKIDIANPTLRKHVNKLADTMLSEQYIRNATSTKVVRKMLQVQNAIFRKLNIGSAINELSDLNAMTAIFGKDMVAGLKYNADKLKEYNIIASQLDPAGAKLLNSVADGKELSSILSARFKSGAKKINDLTNIYHLVETYKASIAIQAAEKLHLSKLESGAITKDEFTKLVLKDFREATLPVDQFTKTALDSFPQYTQYLTWQARNMGKEWNLLTGNLDAGILSDMGKRERVIRNAYTNLPAKTAFWLASNGLKGTAILTAFGLTDFTGMSDQDFSGIEEKDKSNYDKYLAKYANMSTTLGLISDIYQDFEKARLDKQYQERNEEYNPYKGGSIGNRVATTLREQRGTPQFIKNAFGNVSNPSSKDDGMLGLMKKGYSENSSGKVQYLAPTNPADIARGFIFGKRNTHAGKEYSGTSSIATRVGRGENPIVAVKDMALEQVNRQETKYNRPLSNSVNASYSDAVKSLKGAEQKAMFDKGREYNKKLDDLRRNNPDAYKAYIGSLDKDKVNPEMWRERVMRNGKFDETVFNVLKARNQQAAKDFGKEVPPIYRDDLTKEQVKTILQQKSVATGEDTELSSRLWKEKWYADYKNREVEYYKKNPSEFDDSKKTQRVKDWNSLEARRNDLKQLADDKGNIKEWTKRYPLVAERQAIQDKYGYDSSERKAWDRANYDSYKAQKAGYDEEELAIVNGMRKIEGIEPISMARFKPESTTASKSSGGSGGSGRDSSRGSSGFFNYAKYYDGISSGKTGSIKVKANLGNKVNIKRRSGKVTVAKTSRQKARM